MRLALNYPAFPDRIFVRITGFTPTFVRRHKVITLYYIKAAGAPVLVFHRDQDGQLLCPAERLTGNLDQPYTAKCLDYFRDLVLTPQTIQGTFTKHVRVLTFRYQVTPIEPLLLPSVAYVELLADKQVYESPVSAVPLPVQLPRGTFWRVFAAAQTTTDHQVWLSLGGAQWLTNNKTRPHQQNPYLRGK